MLPGMPADLRQPDLFATPDDSLANAVDALQSARRAVADAQRHSSGWHAEDTLAAIEDDLNDLVARLQTAIGEDATRDGEASQDPRPAWFPRYQAA
jgi:hypothetical protein